MVSGTSTASTPTKKKVVGTPTQNKVVRTPTKKNKRVPGRLTTVTENKRKNGS